MNRNDILATAVTSWLTALDKGQIDAEIIIVDWSSEVPIAESLYSKRIRDSRITIVRVDHQDAWILTVANNLAALFARPSDSPDRTLIKLDCDTFTSEDFFTLHSLTAGLFYAGNWRVAKDENELHLNGILVAPLKSFIEVGGYDERIQTYGYDDENLYERLIKSGLKRTNIARESASHLEHEAIQRLHYQPTARYSTDIETSINQILSEKLPLWTNADQKSEFEVSRLGRNSFKAVMLKRTTRNLDLLEEKTGQDIVSKALKRRLVKLGLPKKLLSKRNDLAYLDRLVKTYSKGPMMMVHVQHGIFIWKTYLVQVLEIGSARSRRPW